MAARVLGEVVAAHEPPVAHGAHELLLAGVRPPVTRQLVGAGEPLVAAVPAAAERLLACGREGREATSQPASHKRSPPRGQRSTSEGNLTCVCSQVSLEVGALEVRLPAAREVADVVPPA